MGASGDVITLPPSTGGGEPGPPGPQGPPGPVPEAPSDGQTYGRKNGVWVPVSAGGGGGAAVFVVRSPNAQQWMPDIQEGRAGDYWLSTQGFLWGPKVEVQPDLDMDTFHTSLGGAAPETVLIDTPVRGTYGVELQFLTAGYVYYMAYRRAADGEVQDRHDFRVWYPVSGGLLGYVMSGSAETPGAWTQIGVGATVYPGQSIRFTADQGLPDLNQFDRHPLDQMWPSQSPVIVRSMSWMNPVVGKMGQTGDQILHYDFPFDVTFLVIKNYSQTWPEFLSDGEVSTWTVRGDEAYLDIIPTGVTLPDKGSTHAGLRSFRVRVLEPFVGSGRISVGTWNPNITNINEWIANLTAAELTAGAVIQPLTQNTMASVGDVVAVQIYGVGFTAGQIEITPLYNGEL